MCLTRLCHLRAGTAPAYKYLQHIGLQGKWNWGFWRFSAGFFAPSRLLTASRSRPQPPGGTVLVPALRPLAQGRLRRPSQPGCRLGTQCPYSYIAEAAPEDDPGCRLGTQCPYSPNSATGTGSESPPATFLWCTLRAGCARSFRHDGIPPEDRGKRGRVAPSSGAQRRLWLV